MPKAKPHPLNRYFFTTVQKTKRTARKRQRAADKRASAYRDRKKR